MKLRPGRLKGRGQQQERSPKFDSRQGSSSKAIPVEEWARALKMDSRFSLSLKSVECLFRLRDYAKARLRMYEVRNVK